MEQKAHCHAQHRGAGVACAVQVAVGDEGQVPGGPDGPACQTGPQAPAGEALVELGQQVALEAQHLAEGGDDVHQRPAEQPLEHPGDQVVVGVLGVEAAVCQNSHKGRARRVELPGEAQKVQGRGDHHQQGGGQVGPDVPGPVLFEVRGDAHLIDVQLLPQRLAENHHQQGGEDHDPVHHGGEEVVPVVDAEDPGGGDPRPGDPEGQAQKQPDLPADVRLLVQLLGPEGLLHGVLPLGQQPRGRGPGPGAPGSLLVSLHGSSFPVTAGAVCGRCPCGRTPRRR